VVVASVAGLDPDSRLVAGHQGIGRSTTCFKDSEEIGGIRCDCFVAEYERWDS
jgi:hypothetical protein